MTCSAPSGRICRCCEAGKPCAYVLQLDAKQEAQLVRVLAISGDSPPEWKVHKTTRSAVTIGLMGRDDEPRTERVCDDCGRTTQMFTYLYEFLKTNHVRLPPCPVCVADRIAA